MEYLKPRSLQLEQLQLTSRQERLRRQLQLQLKQGGDLMGETIAEDVKKLLSGSIDDRLEVIERRTKSRLAGMLGVETVPESFQDISYEVTLKRFNRVGQEGMQSYSQEGLSMVFPDSDFAEYRREIDEFKDKEKGLLGPRKGKVRFL